MICFLMSWATKAATLANLDQPVLLACKRWSRDILCSILGL